MRRSLTAVVTALVLVFAAGCGDEQIKADNAYVDRTDRAVRAFETRFQQLQSSFTSVSTPDQDGQTLAGLRAAVDRAVGQLRQVQAPARIAPLHARLIEHVQEYLPAITAAQRGLKTRDPRALAAARGRFSRLLASIATRITATINVINGRLQ